jgi:hypothetical protein
MGKEKVKERGKVKSFLWLFLWSIFLCFIMLFVVNHFTDGILVKYLEEKEKLKESYIEVTDQTVLFKDRKSGKLSYVVVVSKDIKNLSEFDFLVKNEIINVSMDNNLKGVIEYSVAYEEAVKKKMKEYNLEVKSFYITSWIKQ